MPLPEKRKSGNVLVQYQPLSFLKFKGEIAGSDLNKNQFSNSEGSTGEGYARNFEAIFNPTKFKLFDVNLNSFTLKYREKDMSKKDLLLPIRFNSVEFDRDYNTGGASGRGAEVLREAGVSFFPIDGTGFDLNYGFLKKGNNFTSERINGTFRSFEEKNRDISYTADFCL